MAAYYPAPTNSSFNNNYTQSSSAPVNNTTYSVRIDHDFSENLKMWGSYSTRENDLQKALPVMPSLADTSEWFQNFVTHFFRVGLDYSITPNLLNYLVFGTNRSNSQNYAESVAHGNGTDWSKSLGLGNAASDRFPAISTGDAENGLGGGNNDDNVDNGLRLNDAIVWTHGRHNVKIGGDVRFQQYSPINPRNEWINFSSVETAGAQGQGGGQGFASLMLGEADNGGTNVVLKGQRWTSWYYALFAQDDFKIAKNLTLNIGLRYDVDMPRKEAHNNTSNFSPKATDTDLGIPGALVFGDTCKGCNTRWADTWYKDFAPRVGFAWSPEALHQKTVIRGGAGIIYGPLVYDDFGGSMVTGYTANPSAPSNGFDPSFQIDNGMPAFTPPPDEDPGYFNGQALSGSYITPSAGRPATLYNWNLEVQHQLADDLLLTVGYIGNHATDLESNLLNPNNMPKSYFSLGDALYQNFDGNSAGISAPFPLFDKVWGVNQLQHALRPFPQYDYIDQGCCLENVGMSSFNALVASVQRHFHQGMNLQASYTFGKTFTDADSALPNSGVGVAQDTDTDDLHHEKAISAMDIRHTLVFSGLYELPVGKGKRYFNQGIASQVLGGWELGTVERIQSGQPLSFGCEWGIPGFQNCIRYSRMPGVSLKSAVYKRGAKRINPFVQVPNGGSVDPNANTMFNLDYDDVNRNSPTPGPVSGNPVFFYDTNNNYARDCTSASMYNCNGGLDQPYSFGTGIPRTTSEVRTPPYFNNDLSVIKKITLREGYVLSLKGEFLNTFNEHTWSIPDLNPYDWGSFGVPNGTVNTPRNVQFTARFTF
jgi:hypothetical protein